MSSAITPALIALHSNRLEKLRDVVVNFMREHPLQPLEEEIFLVQSNGVAEWLKMTLAATRGVCAATRVELPARFLWRSYRQVLGRDAVPARSALDRQALTWRLMHLLPAVAPRPGFAPLAGFLRDGDLGRRLQLAQRLADLYDQYQVYRSDWLAAWEGGRDVLRDQSWRRGPAAADDQRMASAVVRERCWPGVAAENRTMRPHAVHRASSLRSPGRAPARPLRPRVILFGMTHAADADAEATGCAVEAHPGDHGIHNPCQLPLGRYHRRPRAVRRRARRQQLRGQSIWRTCRWKTCMRTAIRCWPLGPAGT
jgi:exodeoxyribonuclease V gamma subunit